MKRIAIYCGSASPADPRYFELARNVGRDLGERGIGSAKATARLVLEDLAQVDA